MNRRILQLLVIVFILSAAAAERAWTQDLTRMVLIPAGEFIMGSDEFHQEGPAHKVYVDAFYIDTYEVTNAHFCAFLNEQGNQTEAGVPWLDLKDSRIVQDGGRFTPLPGYEDHPVVRVTWYGAAAYARWRNARLPSEAEWEKAVRGDIDGRTYFWGEDIDALYTNYGQDVESTTPVGSYLPNGYGLYDMTGNVWEWCSAWYARDYYYKSPKRNPQGPDSGYARIIRGGGWSGPVHVYAKYLRCSFRYFLRPESTNTYLGFRCARDTE